MGPRKHKLHVGAHWRNLANTIAPSMFSSPAETAELIKMLFGMWTRMRPKNHVLDGGPDRPCQGAIFRGKDMPGHA